MHSATTSFAIVGIDAVAVTVEVDAVEAGSLDTASWSVVGLGDAAIRESRDRVKAALKNSGYSVTQRRVTVNLAPADLKKEGSHYDLPFALGVLASTGRIEPARLKRFGAIGELSLDGSIKPVPGSLPMAIGARGMDLEGLIVPTANAEEASFVHDVPIYPVGKMTEAVAFLRGELEISPVQPRSPRDAQGPGTEQSALVDFADVRGQEGAKRAMEIAASGGHNLVLVGPPGSGKTMLARRLPTILPAMTFEEAIETTKIFSIAGKLNGRGGLVTSRPFRSPHHTASNVALVGGGVIPKPGEVTLAHNGVLFLDEFPEFSRQVLEVLRQPLEDGAVQISRAQMSLTFPAKFILCAAMNPCPCGFMGDVVRSCTCQPQAVQRYRSKISGPLLDRIDLHVSVPAVSIEEMQARAAGEPSAVVRERVNEARRIQTERFAGREGLHCNAQMGSREMDEFCQLEPRAQALLKMAMERLGLSARAYARVLKVSRTIADLAGSETVLPEHVSEAVQYRTLDRGGG